MSQVRSQVCRVSKSFWRVNSEVYSSIFCEKPDLRLNVFREIIYVEQEEVGVFLGPNPLGPLDLDQSK